MVLPTVSDSPKTGLIVLKVSRSWNILALDGSNWQRVDLFEFQIDIEGIVVENIARRCGGFLRKLSLRGCQAVGDNALATFSQVSFYMKKNLLLIVTL